MNRRLGGNRLLVMRHLYSFTAAPDGLAPFGTTAVGISEAVGKSKSSLYPSLRYLCAAGMVDEVLTRVRKPPLRDGKTRRKTVWRCYFLTDEGRAFVGSNREAWSEALAERTRLDGGVEA